MEIWPIRQFVSSALKSRIFSLALDSKRAPTTQGRTVFNVVGGVDEGMATGSLAEVTAVASSSSSMALRHVFTCVPKGGAPRH